MISPERPPSRYDDLRELFERAMTVRYIAGFKLVTCLADEDTARARARMDASGHDALPVVTDGEILGWIERRDLGDGVCGSYEHRLRPSDLVADSTPILELLPILTQRPRVFVLQGNRVVGVASRSDLQKAPVRMLLFALVSLLEMHMQRLVSALYGAAGWTSYLSPARVRAAELLRAERRERHEEVALVECIQFCDRRDLIVQMSKSVGHLGFPTRRALERFLNDAEALRDLLAHGQDLVAGSSWPSRIELVMQIKAVVQRLEAELQRPAQHRQEGAPPEGGAPDYCLDPE